MNLFLSELWFILTSCVQYVHTYIYTYTHSLFLKFSTLYWTVFATYVSLEFSIECVQKFSINSQYQVSVSKCHSVIISQLYGKVTAGLLIMVELSASYSFQFMFLTAYPQRVVRGTFAWKLHCDSKHAVVVSITMVSVVLTNSN